MDVHTPEHCGKVLSPEPRHLSHRSLWVREHAVDASWLARVISIAVPRRRGFASVSASLPRVARAARLAPSLTNLYARMTWFSVPSLVHRDSDSQRSSVPIAVERNLSAIGIFNTRSLARVTVGPAFCRSGPR